MLLHRPPGELVVLGDSFVALAAINQVNKVANLAVGLLLEQLDVRIVFSAGSRFRRSAAALRSFCSYLYRSIPCRVRLEKRISLARTSTSVRSRGSAPFGFHRST